MELKALCMSVAALGFLAFAFNFISIQVASVMAGCSFGLFGLSSFMHALDICPVCRK
jgi:hypothetical protein